jgi:hypothetical protein
VKDSDPTRLDDVAALLEIALKYPERVPQLAPEQLDLLIQCSRRVRLHGRLAADLKQACCFDDLPQVAQDLLESAYVMAEARSRVARWELDRISWATREDLAYRPICLKGCAYLLLGLPNVPGRIFADVDLLISEANIGGVEKLLNERGWKTKQLTPYDDDYYRHWTHELPPLVHVERDVEVDLHHNIVARTSRVTPSSDALIKRSTPLESCGYRVLAGEDLVLHAMTHLMFDSDLGDKLRDLVDIDDLTRHFVDSDLDFWNRLLDRAAELDLRRPTYYSLRSVSLLLKSEVPDPILRRIRKWGPIAPISWLMDQLIPLALYPPHPQGSSRIAKIARLLLFMRSHWIRMPPWLLAYHLSYKFYVTQIRRTGNTQSEESD